MSWHHAAQIRMPDDDMKSVLFPNTHRILNHASIVCYTLETGPTTRTGDGKGGQ